MRIRIANYGPINFFKNRILFKTIMYFVANPFGITLKLYKLCFALNAFLKINLFLSKIDIPYLDIITWQIFYLFLPLHNRNYICSLRDNLCSCDDHSL